MSRSGRRSRAGAAIGGIGSLAVALLFACTSCTSGDDEPVSSGDSIAEKLTRGLRFPQGMVLDGPLPEPTDPRAMLLPLGPTVRVEPGASELMSLRVQDPDERAIEATLIQFSDAPSYVRVPVEEGEGAHIVDNEATAQDDLCEGLCDAIFTVTVTEAVEFTDGEVSQISTRQIVVDCRDHGDPDACDGSDPSAMTEDQLCGDVTAGEIAWTSDPVLDAHLEAVRLVRDTAEVAAETLQSIRAQMAAALAVSDESESLPVADALTATIQAHAQDGLSLLLGEQGCALTFAQVSHALRRCDEQAADAVAALGCGGVCQPSGDAAVCATAESSGCRGLVDGEACAGRCLGACELALAEPAACAGTCIGSCEGECPGDPDDCDGPCAGACTGACNLPSSDVCAGLCRGLCDVTAEQAVPECSTPLAVYCAAPSGGALDCAGDCFGAGPVEIGGGPCTPSALAIGRALPRCEPPMVQLSFAFQPGLAASEQNEFAGLVQGLNASFAGVFATLARIELLVVANADLRQAAEGEIAEHLADLQEQPDSDGLACAEQRLPEAAAWLADESAVLEQLRSEAMLLLSPLTAVE